MINLLPPDQKQTLLYAQRNVRLRRGLVGLCIGLGLLIIVSLINFILIKQEITRYDNATADIVRELKENDEEKKISHMKEINGTLNLVVKVLSGQVLYAELFQQVGSIMPSGTILQNLALSGGSASAVSLQIGSVDFQSGSQALANFRDPNNKIFDQAELINTSCSTDESAKPPYFCTTSIRATFKKDSSFSFLKRQTEQANNARSTQ